MQSPPQGPPRSINSSARSPNPALHLQIPLISKHLNSVEKYISEFATPRDSSTRRPHECESPQIHKLSPFPRHEPESAANSGRTCVQYESISEQRSEERIETLSRLEKDYVLLKEKLQRKAVGGGRKEKPGDLSAVSSEEVSKELRGSIVKENGKEYFADLYLLKRGRDSIMHSLANTGKLTLQPRQGSYEEQTRAREEDFVKAKILRDRHAKKGKMMKGRNLHWNVYYDMLALSSQQKNKLATICKFSQTYGIS